MEYGRQADAWSWGDDNGESQQNDWNSGWMPNPKVPPPTQNFPNQAHQNPLQNKQPADFFDKSQNSLNYSQDYWSQSNVYQPRSDDRLLNEGVYNNNNGTAEVENKEVAPPDNKFLRNAPSSYHQRGGMDVRGQYLPSQNSNPVQPIMNTFQPVNFDGFQQNSQAFPPVSSQMPQMRQFPPQTQSQKLPQTQQTTQQAPQNPQKMPQQVQPPQVSQQILKMPQNPLQQIPPLPHVQQIPPQPQIQQNLPQPQIQQIAPRPQIQQNPPQPQIQQIPHQLPLQMPPQVPQQITQQPQQIVQRRPQQHTQHPPQQLPQQITQQQPQLITQQQPPPISQQQAHQQIEPMNYQQNLVQQPNSFHGYSNSQVPLQVPEPDTQKSRKNSIPPQDEMYYQQSNHFEPSGSRMPEMSHKRSESLPQNFPESASFEGSQAIRYGSERQSSTSSESLTNNYISNKTSVSISESDEPQEQRSVESPDRIQLNSGPLIPPPSQFEHDQMAFFQNKNYGNFPMAASSPLSAQVPENLERPDEQIDVLTQPMTALTINTDDKNSQVCSLDRNQYLETGHLSTLNDAASNIEILDEGDAPPPGLDRLVTGQVCERVQSDSIQSSLQMELSGNDTRLSTPLSFVGDYEAGQRQSGTEGESEGGSRRTRLVQGQSIGDDTDGREVPGEDDPVPSRVVLGQTGVLTPPIQNTSTPRSDRDEMGRRMVVGERAERDQQPTGNISDDYRQKRRHRHHRADSSFDEDDRDYESDRRNDEFKRREERPRRRREHRSPEYRSDEEYDDRRPYHRRGRTERRPRDYNSPERDYREYRDYRDDHRRYRRYDHYREYDDDYYRENRSRPSSRTGSDYRRNMDYSRSQMQRSYHDHSMNNSYMDFNKYSAYEYYEKMRQTDPVRYAAWYEHYMKERYNNLQQSNNYANDRASVHSGQSTSNQRHNVQTPQIVQERSIRPTDDEYDIRLFATNHIKGKLDGQGRLIVIDPNHPLDGQKATVNLFKLSPPILDSDAEEFFESPGPFIPGVTHRNTVLQYLKRISEKAVRSSEKLLYDLIHLTVKGNGEVNEVDVAELLMNSYKKSEIDERDKSEDVPVEKLPEKEVVAKFRELLQQGNKTEALDWAIDNGAWGHALFLASKMDDRTHNQIMIRFANSIPHNDPLQTLYQLMSGHIPQSSTCCADKKWSDWRPHLAMILGNPTRNPALDRKAIIRLGDSLNAHGRLFASHFCYVTAQVDFTHYKPDAKLVLLGSSPNQEFNKFATCRAIMVTMCYEYGLKLRQRDFNIPTLQLYKLILAMRLIDNGRCKNALQYCEMLANEALQSGRSERSLISDVIDVSSRLKMLDPTLALSGETDNDPEWLYKLKHYYDDLPENHDAGLKISHGISSSTISEVGQESHDMIEAHDNQKYNDPYASYNPNDLTMNHLVPTLPVLSQQIPTDVTKDEQPFQSNFVISQPLQQNSYLPEQPSLDPPNQNSYWENQNLSNQNFTPQNPSVTQPTNNSNNFFKTSEEQLKDVGDAKASIKALNEVAPRSKKPETKAEVKNEEQRSGWFGGIWDKLSMRPKNQMRLPDDSNPSIVWDQEKKRWVNLDGEDDTANSVKPPPRAAELGGSGFNVPNSGPQSAPPATNKYKLQKGKLMKSNYVDVMGGSKENKDGPSSLGNLPPLMPTAPVKNNFFIPAPVEGNDGPTDFITPATSNPTLPDGLPDSNNKQLSRCSSVSSLSREVQYYMSPPSAHSYRPPVQPTAPMMYNPTRFQS